MKKIFLFLALVSTFFVFAAPPTASSSNLTFSSIDGKTFSGSFTAGNGANRIVVIKEGSAVTGLPQNGTQYNPASQFGTAGTEFTAPGEYVVARTSWSSFNVENLKPNTVYHVAIFELNGTGAGSEYLMLPLRGSQATVSVPTQQATLVTSANSTGNTLQLAWTKGNGAGRTVMARKGAPVNAIPNDLVFFWGDENFGSGPKLGTDNYVVYKGGGNSVTVKNLEPNSTYYFAVFEYNGASQPVHLTPGATGNGTTANGPSVAPTSISLSSVEGNRVTVGYTAGNGTRRLIVARKNAAVTSIPVNGAPYTAAAFGSGSQLATGEFVVGDVSGTSCLVTNLEAATVYHFRVFEYDVDKAGNTYFLTSSFGIKSGSTAAAPTTLTANITPTLINGNSASFTLTNGNGSYRMVVMREEGAVNSVPANFVQYPGNASFGNGTQLGNGNYSTHWGMNGSSFSVSNLNPGKTYHGAVFEFNGYNYPVYSNGANFSFTVPLEPTIASKLPLVQSPDGGELRVVWTSGNGARRIVVAKKGSAPTMKPTDGTRYTANASFGVGDAIAAGEYVVYNGDSYYFDLKNLEIASTYHYAVYEYNVSENGNADYLTSSFLAATVTTLGYPTSQLNVLPATNIQSASATINFTKGNGESRLFFLKEGSPVDSLPRDYAKYNNNTYGSAAAHIGGGVYCINKTSNAASFNVTALKPKTTYYLSAFEFNGANTPAYLRAPVPTTSFTTADLPGATTPTIAATNGESDNVDGNKLTLKWTKGDGERRIVVMRKAAAVGFVPSNATTYAANANFGAGTDLGGGQYVVYNSNGGSVDITGLQPSETYFATVYEYNGAGDLLRYLTSTKLSIAASTVFAPAVPVSNVVAAATNGKLTLTWTSGDGSGRMIVMKEGSAPVAQPADLSLYPANTVFGNGSQMAADEYVVYAGTGNTVSVTGLSNKRYYFALYEYNGTAAPVYNKTGVTGSAVVSSALPVSLIAFTAKQSGNKVELLWVTAQEANSSYFVVERSTASNRFEAVGTVQSAGNSTTRREYSFSDEAMMNGVIYYRLKQMDKDGKVIFSQVQSVNVIRGNSRLSVYPNPVLSDVRVQLPTGLLQATITVYDVSGRAHVSQRIKDGDVVSASTLPAGTYVLVITDRAVKESIRFVKQ